MAMAMIDKLELGIIYDENGKAINHRSLLKVVLNPFLRIFGFQIITKYYRKIDELGKIALKKCKPRVDFTFKYNNEKKYNVVKRRTLL